MDEGSNPPSPQKLTKNKIKKPLINNRIRAKEVRVIGEDGTQVGVMDLQKAIQAAKEKNLDLIQVTDKANPPVCKIMDYGKYVYRQQKKEKAAKSHAGEIKGIRLRFNISEHDMGTRVKQAAKFLEKGEKVKIDMRLRGREKALRGHAKERIQEFLDMLKERTPIKTERDLKKRPGGFTMIIAPEKEQKS